MRTLGMVLAAVVIAFVSVGCQNDAAQQRDQLMAQNKELIDQNTELRQKLGMAVDPSAVRTLQDEISRRDAELVELRKSLRQPVPGAPASSLEGIDVTYDARAGTVTANLPGDVLFDPGSASLKPSAKVTLNKVLAALKKEYAGKSVRVEGHTDSDPIVKHTEWPDNLALSLARAATVTRYLEQQGLEPKRVATVGWGQYKPKSATSKAANRRVEIVVVMR